jgi:hypothetical protein
MQQMSQFTPARAPLSLWDSAPAHIAADDAPPADVVAAVLQFGDIREEREDGNVVIRFSPLRIEFEDVRLLLGEARARALDVSVVWDEAEVQVVSVQDLAPLRAARALGRRGNAYAQARMRWPPHGVRAA